MPRGTGGQIKMKPFFVAGCVFGLYYVLGSKGLLLAPTRKLNIYFVVMAAGVGIPQEQAQHYIFV